MMNLKLIERQPRWRVWVVAWFSRVMGVCIHVEGIPFGSIRLRKVRTQAESPLGTAQSSGQIGGGTQARLEEQRKYARTSLMGEQGE